MIATPKVRASSKSEKQEIARQLAEGDPVLRDTVLRAAGRQRSAVPLKASQVAEISGHSQSHESRIRSGRRMSALGRASVAVYEAAVEEARPLEAVCKAGVTAAYIEVILKTMAMIPELEKLETHELIAELRKEVTRVETRANSLCNDREAEFLAEGKLPPKLRAALLDGHTQQAASSERICAILQVLANRQD